MKLFVTDPEVIHLGVRFLRTVSLFYLMPAATNGIQGFFRGIEMCIRDRLYAYLDFAGPTGTARDGLAEGMLALAIEKKKLISGQPIICLLYTSLTV